MPRVAVHEAELNVVKQGEGPVLLLVHGFPLDHTMWLGQIAWLAETHRVIAPDLRGFGASTVTPGLVTMQRLADDLAEMLAALNIAEPVTLCGLSMGGYVAWQFALRHRSRLAKLILCDTRAVADNAETAANRIGLANRVQREGPAFIAETMLPKLFGPAALAAQAPFVEATRQVILKSDPRGIAAASRGMAQRPDMTARLAEIDVPALVLCGEHDPISPSGEMQGFAAALPNAQFVEIAGAGHMAPLEKPAEVNAAIAAFLA
ncbi:MAG: alpha/beta fold hydrolase [Pirellulaceae bacterium]|nr:alpha/beta fold hydrolase [Pirellulaceae bacterium]